MGNIINFSDYQFSTEEVNDLKQMVEKVNAFFIKGDEKKEYDLLLYKEYNRLMNKTFQGNWLKGKELKKYMELLKTFHLEDDYIFSLIIMLFTSLAAKDKRILDTKESYIYLLIDVFLELEIPLTRYNTYLACLLEEDIASYFDRERLKDIEPRLLLMVIMEDVHFLNHKDKVMDDLRKELEEKVKENEDIRKRWLDKDTTILEVYEKVEEQMILINELAPIYKKEDFKRLATCKKLRYLSSEKQEEFLKLMYEIDTKIAQLKEKIDQILIAIDIYSMSILDENIITPTFGLERKK